MNPYETPLAKSDEPIDVTMPARGIPCRACGSRNTGSDNFLRARPSIISVMLFGWMFLLIRGAFAMRVSQCRDCGEVRRYKSAGSWVALGVLVFISLLIVLVILGADRN